MYILTALPYTKHYPKASEIKLFTFDSVVQALEKMDELYKGHGLALTLIHADGELEAIEPQRKFIL